MTSENPPSEPISTDEPPPPPPDETPPAPSPEPPQPPQQDDAWAENYEEHVDAEEPPTPKAKRKKRHYGGMILLVFIVALLIVWTVLSPGVLPQSDGTYQSGAYATLGSFSGYVDTWAGNSTWALSVSGEENATVGSSSSLSVLVTKVSEKPSNAWFRGTWINLNNASLYSADGVFIASMSNKTDIGFGTLATVPFSLRQAGDHELYVFVKFTIYADMRIGFLPTKAVEMESARFTLHVS